MLTLSGNLGITDASLIALAFLEHLSLTNLKETSVTMSGLRRFARALHERKRRFILRAPAECQEYMNSQCFSCCVLPPFSNGLVSRFGLRVLRRLRSQVPNHRSTKPMPWTHSRKYQEEPEDTFKHE